MKAVANGCSLHCGAHERIMPVMFIGCGCDGIGGIGGSGGSGGGGEGWRGGVAASSEERFEFLLECGAVTLSPLATGCA